MAFELSLEDLEKKQQIDSSKILNDLLNPENINMKTHIISPITFSILESIILNVEDLLTEIGEKKLDLPLTRQLLKDLKERLKEFLVSWNRQSRLEVTEVLKSVGQEGSGERTFFQKLLGTNKSK